MAAYDSRTRRSLRVSGRGTWHGHAVPRIVAVALVLGVLGLGAAQGSRDAEVHVDRCAPMFEAAVRRGDAATPAGRAAIATDLLRTAFEALEPAYPVRRSDGGLGDPNAAWLRARNVLPSSWSEAEVDPVAWRDALALLQRPYGREPVAVTGDDDPASLRRDVEAALAAGASSVRPLPLVGVEDDGAGGEQVAFATVIWNWTPHARLLAFDLAGRPLPEGSVSEVLDDLGTCAWTPRSWVVAPADAARGFYLGNVGSGVRVLAVASGTLPAYTDVPVGDEESVFRLDHPLVAGEPYVALGFTGSGPDLGTVLRLAISTRTNLGMFDIGRYLAFP